MFLRCVSIAAIACFSVACDTVPHTAAPPDSQPDPADLTSCTEDPDSATHGSDAGTTDVAPANDTSGPDADADATETTAEDATVSTQDDPTPGHPLDPTDPFIVAMTAATHVSSHASVHVHDYEWGALQAGLTASRLAPDWLRFALDRLFIIAPYPTIYPKLRLPPAIIIDATDMPVKLESPPLLIEDTYPAQLVALYALPEPIRRTAIAIIAGTPPAITFIEARLVRDMYTNVPLAVQLRIGSSPCGWCVDGYRYLIGADGEILEMRDDWSVTAIGYCC